MPRNFQRNVASPQMTDKDRIKQEYVITCDVTMMTVIMDKQQYNY